MASHPLSILIYHRVLAAPDPLLPGVPDQRLFARQVALLKRCFRVMPLASAVRHLRQDSLPPRAACITFDDGYADNAELALPVLRHHGVSACFFIASAYLDGGRMWNDDIIEYVRQAAGPLLDVSHVPGLARPPDKHGNDGNDGKPPMPALPARLPVASAAQKSAAIGQLLDYLKYLPFARRQAVADALAPPRRGDLMLRSCQLRSLHAAGMEIGGHTAHHPILAALDDAAARADMAAGKARLEALLDAPVSLFAYPNGKPGRDYDARHAAMAAALGFTAAVSTAPGAARAGADLLQLPRFTPWEGDRPRFLLRLLLNRRRPWPAPV